MGQTSWTSGLLTKWAEKELFRMFCGVKCVNIYPCIVLGKVENVGNTRMRKEEVCSGLLTFQNLCCSFGTHFKKLLVPTE